MIRMMVLAVAFLGIAACATTGPESPDTSAAAESSATSGTPTSTDGAGMLEQVDVQAASEETAVVDAGEDPDEIICRSEKLTGSRIKKRVCLTRAERDQIREVNQANWDADKRKAPSNPRK